VIRELTVQVSGDNGTTWSAAAVAPVGHGHYKAIFKTPAGPTVSLRSHLVDGAGNATDLTVISSYAMH
jgi:hypothetical protein